MQMNWYHWDTNIGQMVACAPTAEAAREQLLATLSSADAARADLAMALTAQPNVNPGQPLAVVAWHQ